MKKRDLEVVHGDGLLLPSPFSSSAAEDVTSQKTITYARGRHLPTEETRAWEQIGAPKKGSESLAHAPYYSGYPKKFTVSISSKKQYPAKHFFISRYSWVIYFI